MSIDSKHSAFFSGGKIKWSHDGSTIFCLNLGAVNVIDIESGKPKLIIGDENKDSDFINCFEINPHGSKLVSSHKSGLFKYWNLSGKFLDSFPFFVDNY